MMMARWLILVLGLVTIYGPALIKASVGRYMQETITDIRLLEGDDGNDSYDEGDGLEGKGKGKGEKQDANFERRKKRKKKKKKEKKCNKPGKKHPKYDYYDCVPTASPAPSGTMEPSWSPTGTPVPTITDFPSVGMTWFPTMTDLPSKTPVPSAGLSSPSGSPSKTSVPTTAPSPSPSDADPASLPTPQPITAAPVTLVPVTEAPVTAAPVTEAPVTPEPTPAPITAAPVTPEPTPAPITSAPVTEAPVTLQPTTSMPSVFPSTSPSTSSPSVAPATTQQSLACEAVANGDVFQTQASISVTYFYELLTFSDRSVTEVAANVDEEIRSTLAMELVVCNQPTRRRLGTLGVGPGTPDEVAAGNCENLDDSLPTETCYRMEGSVELFLSANSDVTPISGAEQVFMILTSTLNARRRKLQQRELQSSLIDPSLGILGLYFLGGRLSDGSVTTSGDVPSSAEEDAPNIGTSTPLSTVGIALIAVACVGVVVVGMFALRKRRHDKYVKDVDGILLDGGDDDTTVTPKNSLTLDDRTNKSSPSPKKLAHVLSDEDSSVFTGLENGIEVSPTRNLSFSQRQAPPPPMFVPADSPSVPKPSLYSTRNYAIGDTVEF